MYRPDRGTIIFLTFLLGWLTPEAARSATLYVDQDNSGTEDGSSWATAYTDLQEALSHAVSGDEIWVAEGTYYPIATSSPTVAQRYTAFDLVEGVTLYGGFAGAESAVSERDWENNATVLSGAIGVPEDDTDNSYHVLRGAVGAVLDGFIVEYGYAVLAPGETCPETDCLVTVTGGSGDQEILRIVTDMQCTAGGGLYNVHADTVVRNTTFRYNYAAKGGAVYNMVVSGYDFNTRTITDNADAPSFEDVVFRENIGTGRGGAVNNDFYTSPVFVNTQFLHNHCSSKGGAVYNDMGCDAYFINTLFADNTAQRGTALISDGSSDSRLVYTTMVGNNSDDVGASLYQGTYTSPQGDGQPMHCNEPHLYSSLVLGNSSASSPSSIDNWHDSAALWDNASTVEESDGSLTATDYLDEDYGTTDPDVGWDPDRDLSTELSTWISTFDSDNESFRTYTDYSYDTSPAGIGIGVVYVDADATSGANNGTSWSDAYTEVSTALSNVKAGQEIWVAEGTYYPTSGTDRTATFVMQQGVSILGGFQGTETLVSQRDSTTYITTLSGDIGTTADSSDNSFHVLFGASEATLDGFVIQDGSADGELYHGRGGGMLIYDGNAPSVISCTFQDNYAVEGGAVCGYNYSSPTFDNCNFTDNSATRGGAMLFRLGGTPTVSGSTFSGNTATDRGGALFVDYGTNPDVTEGIAFAGNSFTNNTSDGNGGAVYVDDKASQLGSTILSFTGDQFIGNTAGMKGGAIAVYNNNTSVTGTDLNISGNTAGISGGGVDIDQSYDTRPTDTSTAWTCTGSCTISGNSPDDIHDADDDIDEPAIQVKRGLYELADSSGSYDFGEVATASSSAKVFTIKNIGEADLSLTGDPDLVSISGTNADDFTVTEQPSTSLGAHRTSSVTIQFSPSATGARTATVTIANDASEDSEHTFTLTGTGTSGISTGFLPAIFSLLLLQP
ncbi:MAG: choice-of-anchor D domain-containing protein [Candidatus Electrothrix sp. GW3-4]|uniref:choice-of-anchor D domain-containing protein n=1 Tax=Candidatus Electrothrix sp. GW3-4 TaxID=3126740 RepID=UPI0030D120A5